jgi:CxxC motif-containing protein (DUF1111 family)
VRARAAVWAGWLGVSIAGACGDDGGIDSTTTSTGSTGGAANGSNVATSGGTTTGAAGAGGSGGREPIAPLPFEPGEENPGGDTTTPTRDEDSYQKPAANLGLERIGTFEAGLALFEVAWVQSGDADRDGLGPTYVGTSCQSCHFRGGRGAPPPPGQPMTSMLVRLSVPDGGGFQSDPRYGDQIQNRAVAGVPAEGWFSVAARAQRTKRPSLRASPNP